MCSYHLKIPHLRLERMESMRNGLQLLSCLRTPLCPPNEFQSTKLTICIHSFNILHFFSHFTCLTSTSFMPCQVNPLVTDSLSIPKHLNVYINIILVYLELFSKYNSVLFLIFSFSSS